MLPTRRLPLGLVDLTLTGAFCHLNGGASLSCTVAKVRALHQLALAAKSEPREVDLATQSFITHGCRRRRMVVRMSNPPLTELTLRVRALQGTVVSEESILSLPSFSEDELLAVYEDLLSNPTTTKSTESVDESVQSSSQASVTQELETYVRNGDVQRVDEFMNKSLDGPPTERQRDLHIKAHIKATPANNIPTSALSLLHAYEAQGVPAPMSSYTRVITALFSVRSSIAHAQAWDLFAHMRYVAHSRPDGLLYALMIRACASSTLAAGRSEPERALDLWTEMTVDRGIAPTVGAYGAIILACARSGEKTYVNEAFRLAKEMLDSHRDAQGRPAFRPDATTFRGLLEGAKRIGDLGRARWILAEMVRPRDDIGMSVGEDVREGDIKVDDEVLMHVFHAYATYKPPFKRSIAVLLDEKTLSENPVSDSSMATDSIIGKGSAPVEDLRPNFSHMPPQSRSEVVGEAKALFSLIAEANGAISGHSQTKPNTNFKDVRLTPRLLNSYLSVHYAHSPLSVSQETFNTVFAQLGVNKTARSYVEAMERCGRAQKGTDRAVALSFAQDLWAEWTVVEDCWKPGGEVDARMIERAYVAMIRVLTLNGDVERAFDLAKSFFRRYPPQNVRKSSAKPAFRSTRTVLVGARPLVRFSSSLDVPDDAVPPLLTFTDVEILHHRLVAAGKREAIGFVKYMCKAYEGALRRRRDATMKAQPAKLDHVGVMSPTGNIISS